MKRLLGISALVVWSAACGGTTTPDPIDRDPIDMDEEFNPAPREGYERIVLPTIANIEPGTDGMWCQWLTTPSDVDVDILDLLGDQSVGGHHAILYATSIALEPGTTRDCRDSDLASVRYLGAIGGEGVSGAGGKLPDGVAYRLPAGYALMANVHYTNYRSKPIDGKAVLDLKKAPADPTRKIASLFVNIDVDIEIPAGLPKTMDVECTMPQDVKLIRFGNHMHERGTKALTEVIRVNGDVEIMRDDPLWKPESTFNPIMSSWPVDEPFILHAGDRVHTRCEWQNTLDEDIYFPTEMCAAFGFYVGEGVQYNCIKGTWTE